MKKIVVLAVILLLASSLFAAELKRVEKLTEDEKTTLFVASKQVVEAQRNLSKVQNDIAKTHNMLGESYTEWRTNYDINGEFILFYYINFMNIDSQIYTLTH